MCCILAAFCLMRHSEHEGLGKSYESGEYGKNYSVVTRIVSPYKLGKNPVMEQRISLVE